jgi:hypothetical protein
MMDPVLPWVDPGEMRRLAEALLSVAAHEPRSPDDVGFGGNFIGFAESAQRPQIQLEQVVTAAPAAATPPLPVTTVAMQAPARPAPSTHTAPVKVRGPFLERMDRFRDGLHGHFAVKGVFILDKDGSVIFDDGDHSRLHFMARSLAIAAKKSADVPGNVHVKVGSTRMLEVIPIDTVFGRIVLGLLVEQPLARDSVVRIVKALQSIVAPPAV